MIPPEGVHHHVRLRRRGGAARVAWLLARAQAARPDCVGLSFELDEPDGPKEFLEPFLCPPGDLAERIAPGRLIHVHATGDWPALLQGFAVHARPWVLTAHDCSLLTGGCVYPVHCGRELSGCQGPCPRDYPGSHELWQAKRRLLPLAKPKLAAPSAWLARQLRQAWPEPGVSVIPNGVEPPSESLDKTQAREMLGLGAKAKVVLFLAHGGLQAAYKGGGGFMPLWRAIKAGEPRALALTVGGGQAERQGDMIGLPYLEGRMREAVFQASNALVYPSLADNHPLVILEAMARGLPVAAYAAGGIPEQIVSGQSGLLVPCGDEAGLAEAVLRLLSDRFLAKTLAGRAMEAWGRHFTAERMAARYQGMYARAGGGHPGAKAG